MNKSFCFVRDGVASDPASLPFQGYSSDGRTFTDLTGQFEAGYLDLADLLDMGFWPAEVTHVDVDPATEIETGIEKTLDTKNKVVECTYTKRPLTQEELNAKYLAANPVPNELSARQFAQVLATPAFDVITEDEALAWASRGDLPLTLKQAIEQLPIDQRFNARMLLASATTYYYDHPIVPIMGQIISGLLQREIDLAEVWREGAKL